MFRIRQNRRTGKNGGEDGYILVFIIFAVTLLIIAMAAAVPAIKTQIQRDREEELVHRGKQYVRAVQLYYRKFGRYPNSIEDLENTNNLRFLRQKYTDPITGKDEWRLIHYGQAAIKPIPAYLRNNGSGGGSGQGTGGRPASSISGAVSNSQGAGAGATNASDMSSRLPGSSIGGGPIVGLASMSEREGLKEIDGKTKYSEWEFVYDPTLDPNGRAQGNNGQGQGNGTNNNGRPNNNSNPAPRPSSTGGR